jgi:hypothetical protein
MSRVSGILATLKNEHFLKRAVPVRLCYINPCNYVTGYFVTMLPKCKCRFSVFHIGQVFSKSHASLLAFSTLTDETQIRPILFVSHHPGLPMQVQPLP